MRFEPSDITPGLAFMLDRVGRSDLTLGFALDDDTLARSHALSPRDPDHAVFHALFDRGAPHAVVISPLQPPDQGSEHKELLKWVVAKQAESAALDRANAQRLEAELAESVTSATQEFGGRMIEAVHDCASAVRASVAQLAVERRQADEAAAARMAARAGALEEATRERWQYDSSARLNFANAADAATAKRDRRGAIAKWIQIGVLLAILAVLCALFPRTAKAQGNSPLLVGGKASGAAIAGTPRQSGVFYIDCGPSTTFSVITSILTCPGTASVAWGSITGTLANQTDLATALAAAGAFAGSMGVQGAATMTGSPVALFGGGIAAPALGAGSCYRIDLTLWNNASSWGSSTPLKITVDGTAVQTINNSGGGSGYFESYGPYAYCNGAASQTAQTIVQTGVGSAYAASAALASNSNPWTVNGYPPLLTYAVPSAVNWASGHTFNITGTLASGTVTGVFLRVGQ